MMKSVTEIERLIDNAKDCGSNFSGMTYLEGVIVALEWVLGNLEDDESPIE